MRGKTLANVLRNDHRAMRLDVLQLSRNGENAEEKMTIEIKTTRMTNQEQIFEEKAFNKFSCDICGKELEQEQIVEEEELILCSDCAWKNFGECFEE